MYPASHDANQAMKIKMEEVSDPQEEADSLQITVQEMKAEPEVSLCFCMPTVGRYCGYAEMALALIISLCGLHVTFLSKITPSYFTLFTNGMFCPLSVRRDSGGLSQ
jgi:hypothetical protein